MPPWPCQSFSATLHCAALVAAFTVVAVAAFLSFWSPAAQIQLRALSGARSNALAGGHSEERSNGASSALSGLVGPLALACLLAVPPALCASAFLVFWCSRRPGADATKPMASSRLHSGRARGSASAAAASPPAAGGARPCGPKPAASDGGGQSRPGARAKARAASLQGRPEPATPPRPPPDTGHPVEMGSAAARKRQARQEQQRQKRQQQEQEQLLQEQQQEQWGHEQLASSANRVSVTAPKSEEPTMQNASSSSASGGCRVARKRSGVPLSGALCSTPASAPDASSALAPAASSTEARARGEDEGPSAAAPTGPPPEPGAAEPREPLEQCGGSAAAPAPQQTQTGAAGVGTQGTLPVDGQPVAVPVDASAGSGRPVVGMPQHTPVLPIEAVQTLPPEPLEQLVTGQIIDVGDCPGLPMSRAMEAVVKSGNESPQLTPSTMTGSFTCDVPEDLESNASFADAYIPSSGASEDFPQKHKDALALATTHAAAFGTTTHMQKGMGLPATASDPYWGPGTAFAEGLPNDAAQFGVQPPDILGMGGIAVWAPLQPVTTVWILDIPVGHSLTDLQRFLDDSGLAGTYDLCHLMPSEEAQPACDEDGEGGLTAVVNFLDPRCVPLCQQLFRQHPGKGVVTLASVQGFEENVRCLGVSLGDRMPSYTNPTADAWTHSFMQVDAPVEGPSLTPATNSHAVPTKTKLCAHFWSRNGCWAGQSCRFAHSNEDLLPPPDMPKLRFCERFLKGQCKGKCKYAHNFEELHAKRYGKTAPCRWWAKGRCTAGINCRYVHSVADLQPGRGPLRPGLVSGPVTFEDPRAENSGRALRCQVDSAEQPGE